MDDLDAKESKMPIDNQGEGDDMTMEYLDIQGDDDDGELIEVKSENGNSDEMEDDDKAGESVAIPSSSTSSTSAAMAKKKLKKKLKKKKLKSTTTNGEGEVKVKTEKPKKTYLPGTDMKEGESLVCDESAYITLHTFTTTAPCLSFDIIPDNLGPNRSTFPLTSYLVGGTQAQRSHANSLIVMKVNNVYKTQPKGSDEELSSDESENEDNEDELTKKPELNAALVPHHGCVNRIRFHFVNEKPLAATWSELGKVSIWDLTEPLSALDDVQKLQDYIKSKDKPKPVFTFKGHRGEGFALDWSPTMPGVLATGDTIKFIHIWKPHESTWVVDQRPFTGHTGSVEDIQWSPNEQHVFASCSVDKTIKIWDTRAKPTQACLLTKDNAHEKDVNVIHWNRKDPFIASGGDDCALRIWDLRSFGGESVAEFRHHHKSPICSVQWSPHESTVLATAGEDDQVAIWDLAVEKDPEEQVQDDVDVPPQLLFIHQGQQDIKEVQWHPQIPGVLISTSATGFNIFKPVNA